MRKCLILSLLITPFLVFSQPDREWLKRQSEAMLPEAVYDLADFLRIPNNGNFENDVISNLGWCFNELTKRGFSVERIDTDGMPLLFAQKLRAKRLPTVLFYLQIDGQPVDSSEWEQFSPYEPVLKKTDGNKWTQIPWDDVQDTFDPGWRIFARSASDSKGPAMSLIKALDILRLHDIDPEFNIKLILDFQEELGSPDLAKAVSANREKLQADFLAIMDGTRHISDLPTLCYGARGIATISLKVYGPKEPLHSGQYGNYAPNPVFQASRLIASMKDENGRVLIPGFYEGIELSDKEKSLLNQIPENEESLNQRLGISSGEQPGDTYQESLQYPSLNIRGLKAAWTGEEVRTIIPSEVDIEIDMRLVPETPGDRQVELVRRFISQQGYHILDSDPTDKDREEHKRLIKMDYRLGSQPFRTPLDSPISTWLSQAFDRAFNSDYVKMRTTGGSQPIAPFINELGIPAVSIRIPNPDNNIHAPNENLALKNFQEGIMACLAILTQPVK